MFYSYITVISQKNILTGLVIFDVYPVEFVSCIATSTFLFFSEEAKEQPSNILLKCLSLWQYFCPILLVFVNSAHGERDIVAAISVMCMCVPCACMLAFMDLSGFVRAITSKF